MIKVQRYDRGELRKPERLKNGFMKVDARLTRTGVFIYRTADGGTRRELRLPEEVFKGDSMETFHLAPLTLGHPSVPVTADNFKEFTVGTVGKVVRDGKFQRAPLMIKDQAAVEAVEAGITEISNGYFCDLEDRSGTFNGERFDAIQRNIRGNHVAIVSHGRAGSDVAIRMDETCAVMTTDDELVFDGTKETESAARGDTKEKTMKKITIDGIDYEGGEQLAQAVAKLQSGASEQHRNDQKAIEDLEDKLAASQKESAEALTKETVRADAAEEKAKELEEKVADISDPAKVKARIDARLDLERTANRYLGDSAESGEKTDREIKEAVIMAMFPKANLDEKDDGYIDARFDAACELDPPNSKNDTKSALAKSRGESITVDSASGKDELTLDSEKADRARRERSMNAWQKPLKASVDGGDRQVNLSNAGVR